MPDASRFCLPDALRSCGAVLRYSLPVTDRNRFCAKGDVRGKLLTRAAVADDHAGQRRNLRAPAGIVKRNQIHALRLDHACDLRHRIAMHEIRKHLHANIR